MSILELVTDPAAWLALITLIVMEVVLGIDNLVFISILSNKLPEGQRSRVRRIGISLALVMRIALLFSIFLIVGMVKPVFDLGLRMPAFRRQMVQKVARDEWLYPNMNTGCVIKFDASGQVLDVLWDLGGENHPMITSIREHKGHLYLGGIYNNRVGRIPIAGADPNWNSLEAYWGART